MATHLSPYDLSQSVDVPGQVNHPKVVELMRTVAEKAHAAGVTLGAFAKDVPGSRKLMELGVRYVMCGVDGEDISRYVAGASHSTKVGGETIFLLSKMAKSLGFVNFFQCLFEASCPRFL